MPRLLAVALAATIAVLPAAASAQGFDLPAPQPTRDARRLVLWATQYFVHSADEDRSPEAVPLADRNGRSLGVALSVGDWCDASLEGTVAVRLQNGALRTFNYGRSGQRTFADCSSRYRTLQRATLDRLNKSLFFEVPPDESFGFGLSSRYRLVPFRSIAVDPGVIKAETVLHIPGLRGAEITLPDGTKAKHDGYVMAVDRGGAIRGNHIDFFTGTVKSNPAPAVIASRPERTFEAFVVNDAAALSRLREAHLRK